MSIPSIAQLKQAVTIAEQIEKLHAELAGLVGGTSSIASAPAVTKASPTGKKGKRTMSPATIAKMKASQQARWAKKRGASAASAAVVAPKSDATPAAAPKRKKGKLSPEGRARIVAALKARWAAKKKAAK